jgi:hypothetical protein
VTDDSCANIWETKMSIFGEREWARVSNEWDAWKERHGDNYFRLGAPSKIKEMAQKR